MSCHCEPRASSDGEVQVCTGFALCRWRTGMRYMGRTSSASSSSGLLPFFGRFPCRSLPSVLSLPGLLGCTCCGLLLCLHRACLQPLCWLAMLVRAFPPSLILSEGFPALPAAASASAFTMPPCSSQLRYGISLYATKAAVRSCCELATCCACSCCAGCTMQALGACSFHR